MAARKYTEDEAAEILRRALERQQDDGTLAHDELVAAAREVGIEAHDLEAAAGDLASRREIEVEVARAQAARRRGFAWHASVYVLVTLFLFAINRLITPYPWFLFPALAWGLGLAIHAVAMVLGTGATEEQVRRRLERRAKRARTRRRKEEREPLARSAREFERSVEMGVAALLDVVAHKVREGSEQLARGNEAPRELQAPTVVPWSEQYGKRDRAPVEARRVPAVPERYRGRVRVDARDEAAASDGTAGRESEVTAEARRGRERGRRR